MRRAVTAEDTATAAWQQRALAAEARLMQLGQSPFPDNLTALQLDRVVPALLTSRASPVERWRDRRGGDVPAPKKTGTIWIAAFGISTEVLAKGIFAPAHLSICGGLHQLVLHHNTSVNLQCIGLSWQKGNISHARLQFDAIQPRDLLVWIGVIGYDLVPWIQLRARMVRTAWYSSEPLDDCVGARARHVSLKSIRYTSDGQQCTVDGGCAIDGTLVDEVWDYSAANLRRCNRSKVMPSALRLTPPGYIPNRPLLLHHYATSPPRLLFLGSVSNGSRAGERRNECWKRLGTVLGDRLLHTTSIQTTKDFDELVQGGDYIFLNIHKRCGDYTVPLESFRMQTLLSPGQLVISEGADAEDMARLKGMVTFSSTADIIGTYLRMANLSLEARQAAQREVHAKYFRKHANSQILRRAGVFEMVARHFNLSAQHPLLHMPYQADV